MSSTRTPSRTNLGPMIPMLDTKPQVADIATALTYAGLHTPPHSAHESYRASSQCSWLEEPASAGHQAPSHSLPSTPVGVIHPRQDSFLRNCAGMEVFGSALDCSRADAQFLDNAVHHHCVDTPLESNYLPEPKWAQQRTPFPFGVTVPPELLSSGAWVNPADSMTSFTPRETYLGPKLFPTAACSILSENGGQGRFPCMKFDAGLDVSGASALQPSGLPSGNIYPPTPQIVVPSQLAPDDTYHQQPRFGGFSSPEHSNDGYSNGFFSSSSSGFGSFESIDPLSPMEMYMDDADDEADLLMVNPETPSKAARTLRSTTRGAVSKRASKRSGAVKEPWHQHETAGVKVQCKGEQFSLDGPVQYEKDLSRKFYACTFVKGGEVCGSRFERNEHLKRHMGSHSTVRAYPCPLDDCKWRISRPDNACDHLKTHLKFKTKHQRNARVEWPVLRDAILRVYEDKKVACKLIDNLQRWIDSGMRAPLSASRET